MKTKRHGSLPDAKQARKIARHILAPALSAWGNEQRVCVFYEKDGYPVDDLADAQQVLITRGGELVLQVPRAWALGLAPEARKVIAALIGLLQEQVMIAEWTQPFAKFDVDVQRVKAAKGAAAGRKSAKASRPAVEQQVRACLRRRDDPSSYVSQWAEEYDYSPRHIRNIITKIRAE